MNSQEFIEYCRGQITKLYEDKKAGNPDNTLKHRTEGLCQAAKMLGVMTEQEIKQLIESEHQKVFNESVADRQIRKQSLADMKATSPDKYYEIPTIERKK